MIAGHNLWPAINPTTPWQFVMATIHNTPFFIPNPPVLVTYVIVPWIGVMLAGYLIGPWFLLPEDQRNKRLRAGGLVLLVSFVLLRSINIYGDPSPYSIQDRGWIYTALSFVNVSKYPPSLLFLCITLGIALLLLPIFKNPDSRINRVIGVYGKVPFFFFVLHFALISLTSYLWTWIDFGTGINLALSNADARPAEYVPNLARVYLVWFLILVITYFPCRWFGKYKMNHKNWWLSYL
jgi:uncharacterized membrane protein